MEKNSRASKRLAEFPQVPHLKIKVRPCLPTDGRVGALESLLYERSICGVGLAVRCVVGEKPAKWKKL